jgi:hypothetical protein
VLAESETVVSPEPARSAYGVAIDPERMIVREDDTAAPREPA